MVEIAAGIVVGIVAGIVVGMVEGISARNVVGIKGMFGNVGIGKYNSRLALVPFTSPWPVKHIIHEMNIHGKFVLPPFCGFAVFSQVEKEFPPPCT